MNILVTGGLGFIGSHIVDSCINKKHKVLVVDNGSSIVFEYKNPKAEYFKIDITSSELVNIFKKYSIDYCIHLAAQISVTSSVRNPINDANINILGSLNLIRLCKKYGLKK